ncbi:MAG: hypothetical protein HOP30_20950 [Cyclobacteriaceae bacterium]|nr:hypothetical protein [Cyclobacteriaceae bacterium]
MMNDNFEQLPYYDVLLRKVFAYYDTIWMDRRIEGIHESWIENFTHADKEEQAKERLNAIYLLTKFMYFGNIELRELLKCLYRDLFKYEIVKKIRQSNQNTHDSDLLENSFFEQLEQTRFLGVGNPSESGVHLLYYFRQENGLAKKYFINTHEIFKQVEEQQLVNDSIETFLKTKLSNPKIKRYIFIDDLCVSGSQAKEYSKDIVTIIKKLDPTVEVAYLMLIGTEEGIREVKKYTKFDAVKAVFTIDQSFKCFSEYSRFYNHKGPVEIDKDFFNITCEKYGRNLFTSHPLGYNNGQLLLGLFHNTPDNTLPIFWADNNWSPIFKRYPKN